MSRQSGGCSGCIVMLLLIVFLSMIVNSFSPRKKPQAPPAARQRIEREESTDDRITAKLKAQEVVAKFLKHPLDATFSWFSDAQKQGPNRWYVNGTVKAKNDFGAELTHEYRVWFDVEGGQWGIHDVEIDGESVIEF